MDWIQIVVLALIQGLTEFLPVSSSAHLVLPTQLLGWPEQGVAFDVALHVGTLTAVLWYFRKDLVLMVREFVAMLVGGRPGEHAVLSLYLIVAMLPLLPAGIALAPFIDDVRSTAVIAATTIIFGLLLGVADRRGTARSANTTLNWKIAVFIGVAQVFALIPGTSRSGVTMTAGLLAGLGRTESARFSFLLSIPAILASGAFATLDLVESAVPVDWTVMAIGAVISAICAWATIHQFLALVGRIGMMPFVVYRLLLGAGLLAMILMAA